MLERLLVAETCTCTDCKNTAFWSWLLQPMCYSHLRGMADMNSDNETAVYLALVSPVVIGKSATEVILLIYPTTCVAPVCSVLNQLPQDKRTIGIQAIEEKHWHDGTRLECVGRGYYRLSSTSTGCHAPMIEPVGLEIGRMVGFANDLNEYSRKIRANVGQEFGEEEGVCNG